MSLFLNIDNDDISKLSRENQILKEKVEYLSLKLRSYEVKISELEIVYYEREKDIDSLNELKDNLENENKILKLKLNARDEDLDTVMKIKDNLEIKLNICDNINYQLNNDNQKLKSIFEESNKCFKNEIERIELNFNKETQELNKSFDIILVELHNKEQRLINENLFMLCMCLIAILYLCLFKYENDSSSSKYNEDINRYLII